MKTDSIAKGTMNQKKVFWYCRKRLAFLLFITDVSGIPAFIWMVLRIARGRLQGKSLLADVMSTGCPEVLYFVTVPLRVTSC
jgi:hypothetical protein